jgi:hypothetical protein
MKAGCSTSGLRNDGVPSQPSGHMDTGRYPVTANRGAFYGSAHPLRMGDRSCPDSSNRSGPRGLENEGRSLTPDIRSIA